MPNNEWSIYHNPRCSKSRAALELLNARGVQVRVIEYLKTPPSADELRELLRKLNLRPHELLRTGESVFKQDYSGKQLSDTQCIAAMVAHPVLIERPIVVRGERAVVGRPTERVADLL